MDKLKKSCANCRFVMVDSFGTLGCSIKFEEGKLDDWLVDSEYSCDEYEELVHCVDINVG